MNFSIIIPSWNNLAYLQLCCEGILQNSTHQHQIIIHINEGKDGTLDWVKSQQLDYTYTPHNAGICEAVNAAAGLAVHPYIMYMNDDMYPLPKWDEPLVENIKTFGEQLFMMSATMIEPKATGNAAVIVRDFGRSPTDFKKQALLDQYQHLQKADWNGASWPPVMMPKKLWQIIGGFSIEFSPGMYSDPDLSRKAWQAGCRLYKGVGASKVYHFMASSTGRVKKNNGRLQFIQKWQLTPSAFHKYYIKLGTDWQGKLEEPDLGWALRWQKLKAYLNILMNP